MPNNIGDIIYNSFLNQECSVREKTENSINSLFQRKVISETQRDKLLQMYLNGEVSFGEDGLSEEEAKNFTQETYNSIEQTLLKTPNGKAKTLYIIQAGDTPEGIAQKLGFTGEEAKRFALRIKSDAIKNGMYFKYGFKVGDMISLQGDFRDIIEKLKKEEKYLDTSKNINNNYKQVKPVSQKVYAQKAQRTGRKNDAPRNINEAVDVFIDANKISDSLQKSPSPANRILDSINSKNAAFVLLLYNRKTGRNLAQDLINNGDKYMIDVKNKICWHLAKRAQELDINGVYFGDYMDETNPAKLIKWIYNAQAKIIAAEKANNSAIKDIFIDTTRRYVKTKPVNELQKSGAKLAKELYNKIEDDFSANKVFHNRNNEQTIAVLRNIRPENAAFVVAEYKKLAKKSITRAIDDEIGLDFNHVKQYICKNLVSRAKSIGLTGIYHGDYMKISDINALENWVEKMAQRIIKAETANAPNVYKETPVKSSAKSIGKYTIKTTTSHPLFKEGNISRLEETFDYLDRKIDKKYYYRDGKVVQEKCVASNSGKVLTSVSISQDTDGNFHATADGVDLTVEKDRNGHYIEIGGKKYYIKKVRILLNEGNAQNAEQEKITEPVDISISLPANASREARLFAKSLEENKAKIMQELNIDNDTYNKLARLAIAIAEQETNFGAPQGERSVKYSGSEVLADTIPGRALGTAKGSALSCGLTQIKYNDQIKDEDVKRIFENLGIHSESDLFDPKKSAVATVALLAVFNQRIKKNENIQKGINAANGVIVEYNNWEMVNGHAKKTGNTKPWINKVTAEDALCYYWNQGPRQLINGSAEPEANDYTRNIHKYLTKYTIVENKAERASAIQKSRANRAVKNFKPMDNNGPIGSIIFMPKMYTDNQSNTADEIEILKTSLAKNPKIDSNSKKLLIWGVKNGEIGFEFGLSAQEADALTQRDIDQMLSQVANLKMQIEAENRNINFSDGINNKESYELRNRHMLLIRKAELTFKKGYLNSLSPKIKTSAISLQNILMTPMNNDLDLSKSLTATRRGFAGMVQDDGINSHNTSAVSRILAEYARNVAHEMNTSGYCMTGFRRAMLEAGISAADTNDLSEGTPRATVNWFERHPDMFEEVKYINIGNGNARQINSTDLPNLPAGYIVVWIPDNRFKQEPGHISITNGNGQAYADETDNLDWGVYHGRSNSGKGEHGTFRVFRLTDKWKVENGKLKFCK